MLTRLVRQRGYLGPIGDDIPSLIPILVGLITFFAAFTFTLNEYNSCTQSFSADRDTLIIANALKGDSYVATFGEFDSACKGLRVRGLNYVAGIIESSRWQFITQDAQDQDLPKLAVMANYFYVMEENAIPNSLQCAGGLDTPVTVDALTHVLSNRPFIVLSFPIALQVDFVVVPATLVVITWRV
jgi:hypothetical protein